MNPAKETIRKWPGCSWLLPVACLWLASGWAAFATSEELAAGHGIALRDGQIVCRGSVRDVVASIENGGRHDR